MCSQEEVFIRASGNVVEVEDFVLIVNTKSGAHAGQKLLTAFSSILPRDQICNLVEPGSLERTLEVIKKKHERVKVVIAGGNGTSQSVMTAIERLGVGPVTIGLVPIGVGNDLGRVFGWIGVSRMLPSEVIATLDRAPVTMLDRWHLVCRPTLEHGDTVTSTLLHRWLATGRNFPSPTPCNCNKTVPGESCFTMNNYFTIGPDAHAILRFHYWREGHPWLFFSRTINMLLYFASGLGTALTVQFKPINKQMKIYLDEQTEELSVPDNVTGIIISNLPSIFGGIKPWGPPSSHSTMEFREPSCSDGLVEVMGIRSTWHLGALLFGACAIQLGQANSVKIAITEDVPAQVDGEPFVLPPSAIKLDIKMQERVLFRSEKKKSSKALKQLMSQSGTFV